METPEVWVRVSREPLAEMGEWSAPVQIKIEHLPSGEWDLIARTHTCGDKHDDR
jgi:hypothetical protein